MTLRCVLCQFDVELDGVKLDHKNGTCICERCYERETHAAKPMPKQLRQELTELLKSVEPQ